MGGRWRWEGGEAVWVEGRQGEVEEEEEKKKEEQEEERRRAVRSLSQKFTRQHSFTSDCSRVDLQTRYINSTVTDEEEQQLTFCSSGKLFDGTIQIFGKHLKTGFQC